MSFFKVVAFPNDSRMGLERRMRCSRERERRGEVEVEEEEEEEESLDFVGEKLLSS